MRARLILAALVVSSCGSDGPAPSDTSSPPVRVLMVTATAGFRHDSIDTAVNVMRSLATSNGLVVTSTEDLSMLSPSRIGAYDVVMFALTSGELPLTSEQQMSLIDFVSSGRGFVGVHSATDTLYEWPDYGRLVGAYFREHPWTQQATVIVEDSGHPATTGLGDRFVIREEFYTFRENPRGRVQVLLRLDASSVSASGDFPLAWSHSFGTGRAYYNALGHFSETWMDQRFQRQLTGAIRWAAAR